jgi:hypothetical protein
MTTKGNGWWVFLAAYAACGLVLGLADPLLGRLAVQLGVRPGMATAATVNVLLPLAAAVLALGHGRIAGACLGAALMTLGLVAGLAINYPSGVRDWSPLGILASMPPVLVLAGFGYAAVGTITVFGAWSFRNRRSPGEAPPGGPGHGPAQGSRAGPTA